MEFENKPYGVYVRTDTNCRIVAVNSTAFLVDATGWVKIDEGYGDRYHHAQANYFPDPIITGMGAYRYKLVDGVAAECTAEEIAEQEEANKPAPTPSGDDSAVWDELDAAYREGVNGV